MSFQNLRNNNIVYILHKDTTPYLEIGKVTVVSPPTPKFGGNNIYNELVVDITVDINGTTTNFLKLPVNLDIVDFGNNMVVACDKSTMNNEIMSMKLKSLDIVDSIELHENIVKKCDEMLLQLNPEIVEKLKQEKETKELKDEINSLKDMVKELINQLK